jgi:hypothetical protein
VKVFVTRWINETKALKESRLSPMTQALLRKIVADVQTPLMQ